MFLPKTNATEQMVVEYQDEVKAAERVLAVLDALEKRTSPLKRSELLSEIAYVLLPMFAIQLVRQYATAKVRTMLFGMLHKQILAVGSKYVDEELLKNAPVPKENE